MSPYDLATKLLSGDRKQTLAITTFRGRIVSFAFNSYTKTHPYQAKLSKTVGNGAQTVLHAEVRALSLAKSPIDSIWVFRQGKAGWLNAKPCPICKEAIRRRGVENVFHTT